MISWSGSNARGNWVSIVTSLMRFAEQCCKRHVKDLITIIIGDVQDPAAPVFRARRHDQRSHGANGMLASVIKVIDRSATPVDQHTARIGEMKIDVRHVLPPQRSNRMVVGGSSWNIAGKFRS